MLRRFQRSRQAATDDGGSAGEYGIRYDLPAPLLTRLPGGLISGFYARWCTVRMADDGIKAFECATGKALGNAGRQ